MGSPVPAARGTADDIHILVADAAHAPAFHGPGQLGLQSLQHLQVREILLRGDASASALISQVGAWSRLHLLNR